LRTEKGDFSLRTPNCSRQQTVAKASSIWSIGLNGVAVVELNHMYLAEKGDFGSWFRSHFPPHPTRRFNHQSPCICGKAAENGAFRRYFRRRSHKPRSGRRPPSPFNALARHQTAKHLAPRFCRAPHATSHFCSLKAQTGYLHILAAFRILFKGRVRLLSVEDGSP
jgi:hypothetical protein